MTQIKIFQPETYPKNIVEVRNEIMNFSDDTKNEIIHEEYLRDYASSKLWDLDSEFGKIHNRLMNYMEGYNIVAYHNTRLLNPSILVLCRTKDKSFDEVQSNYKISIKFKHEIELENNSYKKIRKLLEMAKKNMSLLMNEDGKIYAM